MSNRTLEKDEAVALRTKHTNLEKGGKLAIEQGQIGFADRLIDLTGNLPSLLRDHALIYNNLLL